MAGTLSVERLSDLADQGLTVSQIAAATGCPESTVRYRARRHGITIARARMGRPGLVPVDELRRCAGEGMSYDELAAHFQTTRKTIHETVKRHGIAVAKRPGGTPSKIDLADLRRLAAAGQTRQQIAEHFGVSHSHLSDTARAAGIAIRRDAAIDLDALRTLTAQGQSVRQIAEHFGVTRGAVYIAARRHDIPLTRERRTSPSA